jgi:hypothetical protein
MFDPSQHTIKVRGNAEYLPVSARLVWFRSERPSWGIITEPQTIDVEREFAIFRCSITDDNGRVIATATKMEDRKGFGDWLEKAETGSIGRALALCGFGAAHAPEMDEGDRLADTPLPTKEPEPDPRYALLDSLKTEADRVGIGDRVASGSYPDISKLAGAICRAMGRHTEKFLSVEDLAFAVSNTAKYALDERAKAVAARPAPTVATEDNSIPTMTDRLLDAPAPTVTVSGNYATNEPLGNMNPTGGKRKVS